IAYAVAFMILLVLGIIFYVNVTAASLQQYPLSIQVILNPLVTLFLFTTPALTMRSLSEEQRSGTLELLLTSPVRDFELVVGKWLAGFLFLLTITLVTLAYAIILNRITDPGIDQGLLIAGYGGLILLSAAFIAIGVATSSIFSNQIAAFFTTLGILMVFWMIGVPAQITGANEGASLLSYLDMSEHYFSSFFQGIVQLQDIIFYLSVTALALLLGTVSIETRRWR
ncbi:MAG TPA: ABC transporter permease, partial [Anaerolineaceae bacterium]|nr:ABC transporter permease [Anaerolineaceae bacterium]